MANTVSISPAHGASPAGTRQRTALRRASRWHLALLAALVVLANTWSDAQSATLERSPQPSSKLS